jgi:hypothetical protein
MVTEADLTPPFSTVAQKGQDSTGQVTLPNMEFFPDIALRDFQSRYRVDNGAGEDRQIQALQQAMTRINRELLDDSAMEEGTNWVCQQVRNGFFSLETVPANHYGDCNEKVMQYRTAVYAHAKARLVERYRDTQTTRLGHDRADDLELTADDYDQESREAVRQLLGKPRCTIELV